MSARCEKCAGTGEVGQQGFLDCTACTAADDRRALNEFRRETLHGMRMEDALWMIHQRAVEQERAKARAELERIMRYYDAGDYKAHEHLRDELARIA